MTKAYILLVFSVLCIGVYFAVMNVFQKRTKPSLAVSLMFAAGYAFCGLVLLACVMKFQLKFTWFALGLGALISLCYMTNLIMGIKILSVGGISLFTIFMMLGGMIVPFVFGILFLNEPVTPLKLIAVLLMIVSLVLATYTAGENGAVNKKKLILYCITVFFSNGGTSVIATVHQHKNNIGRAVSEIQFSWMEYLFTFTFSVIILIVLAVRKRDDFREALCEIKSRGNFVFPAIYVVFVAVSNICLLKAVAVLPASVQFPMITGGTIIVSTLIGRLFFKEKVSLTAWAGVVLTVGATIMFAF